jgi:pheromone shutdown protein TraB
VVHGDRDARDTLARLAGAIDLSAALSSMVNAPPPPASLQRVVGAGASMEEAVELLKNRETVAEMTRYIRTLQPAAVRVMLDERDDILAQALRGCTGKVVGVVGLAHVDGIERRWAAANGEELPLRLRGG